MRTKISHLRVRVLIILLFLFVASLGKQFFDWRAGTGSFGIGLPSAVETFSSPSFEYSIKYPKSWKVVELPNGNHGDQDVIAIISFIPRPYPDVFILKKIFPNGNQTQVSQWAENWARKRKGINQFSQQPVSTSNYSGQLQLYTFIYDTGPFGKSNILCKNYSFLVEGDGFLLSFCADQESWNTWGSTQQEMIDSFSVK